MTADEGPLADLEPVKVPCLLKGVQASKELLLARRTASVTSKRRFDEAAGCWRELLGMRGCPTIVARESGEALAIHHEHRLHDFAEAKRFALKTLERAEYEKRSTWTHAARHRVARIERKMEQSEVRSLKSETGSLGLEV